MKTSPPKMPVVCATATYSSILKMGHGHVLSQITLGNFTLYLVNTDIAVF